MKPYVEYLVPKSGKRATHVWVERDTACRMYSTGGLRRTDKYDIVDRAERHKNHRKICAMCLNAMAR